MFLVGDQADIDARNERFIAKFVALTRAEVASGVVAEREACARLCESFVGGEAFASAIRARAS